MVGAVGGAISLIGKELLDRRARRRSDVRERAKSIETDIRTLEARAIQYWLIDAADPKCAELAREVKQLSRRVGDEIRQLEAKGFSCATKCRFTLTALRQAATDGHFETQGRAVELNRHSRISDAANSLIRELRGALELI